MKYGTTKIVSIVLLALAVLSVLLCRFLPQTAAGLLTAAGVLLAAAVAVIAVWGRCPHCGKHLIFRFFKHKECPQCGRELDPDGKYGA